MDVSFETCLRRREDALMRQRCYVLLRRRHDIQIRCRGYVPLRYLGCFIRDVPAMLLGRTKRRYYDVVTTSFCRLGNSVSPKRVLYENENKVLGSCSFVFKICSYHIKFVLTHQVNINLKHDKHKIL